VSVAAGSATEDRPPFSGYDSWSTEEISARLPGLSQVDLAAVESYERDHLSRRTVLDKLRYMRTSEPIAGYDALSAEQIAAALASADATTVKAVRDYERKFRNRPQVMDDAAQALTTAKEGPTAELAREERAARVRDGFASRAKTARDLRP
jgi:uncharacterized protein (DUF433 family)